MSKMAGESESNLRKAFEEVHRRFCFVTAKEFEPVYSDQKNDDCDIFKRLSVHYPSAVRVGSYCSRPVQVFAFAASSFGHQLCHRHR